MKSTELRFKMSGVESDASKSDNPAIKPIREDLMAKINAKQSKISHAVFDEDGTDIQGKLDEVAHLHALIFDLDDKNGEQRKPVKAAAAATAGKKDPARRASTGSQPAGKKAKAHGNDSAVEDDDLEGLLDELRSAGAAANAEAAAREVASQAAPAKTEKKIDTMMEMLAAVLAQRGGGGGGAPGKM
jgi:hypothetical protein